jgi:hypothetical protein
MSFLNLFKLKIINSFELLLINFVKKRKLLPLIEIQIEKSFKRMKLSFIDNNLYNKLKTKFKDNTDINVINEYDNIIIKFKNPSFGFSLRIKKIEDNYIKSELLLNKMLCYSEDLGYSKSYHIHYTIESIVHDIYSVFDKILKFKLKNPQWIRFTFIVEDEVKHFYNKNIKQF